MRKEQAKRLLYPTNTQWLTVKVIKVFIFAANLWAYAVADELSFAVGKMNLSFNLLEKNLGQSMNCFEELGEKRYRESFCQSMKGQLRGFDYYIQENEAAIRPYFDQLKNDLQGTHTPPALKAFKRMIDDEYQRCRTEDEAFEEETYGAPALQSNVLKEQYRDNPIFPYSPERRGFILNPEVMNKSMMEFISSVYALPTEARPQFLKRANGLAQTFLQLRKKIYLDHPELIQALALEVEYPSAHQETFWGHLYEKTGLTKDDFSKEQQAGFLERTHIAMIEGLLHRGYKLQDQELERPQDFMTSPIVVESEKGALTLAEHTPQRGPDQRPILNVEIIVKETQLDPKAATRAMIALARGEHKMAPQNRSVISALSGRYQEEVLALELELKKFSADLDGHMRETPFLSESDYCQDIRERRISRYASLRHLVDFYSDRDNLKFIEGNFKRARDLMKDTLSRSNMSTESKSKLQQHLDEAQLVAPQLDGQTLDAFMKERSKLYFEAKKLYPNDYAPQLIDEIGRQLTYFKNYSEIENAQNFMGVNASYHPDDGDQEGAHKIICTCGMGGKAVQQNNPDFLLGVLGHELGHALDPSFASRTRKNYSAHSLEMMDELRNCLIKNNDNLWTKSGEDFADYWEANMRAEMIRQDAKKADWQERKLKMMLEQYSNICDVNENVLESHSASTYRAYHVMSQPEVRAEFSELNLPLLPFCEVIEFHPQKGASDEK